MVTVALLDACVLFPMPICDTLLRVAEQGLYRIHFSQEILNETTRNLVKKKKITEKKALRYEEEIKKAFPDAITKGYEKLILLMTNHPKDRHVVAAAITVKADVIVTFNLKDFPSESVEPFNIKVQHPDDFLLDIVSEYGILALIEIIQKQAKALKNPPLTIKQLLQRLNHQVPNFATCLVNYYYGAYLSSIAKQAIELLGSKNKDGSITYFGQQYILTQKDNELSIEHNSRGIILKNSYQEINAKFILEDLDNFEKFKRRLERLNNN